VAFIAPVFLAAAFVVLAGATACVGADLVWQVESPFRFFKRSTSFDMYAQAYPVARGEGTKALPADIIWRTERKLNDPDCRDASTPDRCLATARSRYDNQRLGWAAETLDAVCYDSSHGRYLTNCERRYSWGTAREDYVLPEAHTVAVKLSKERLAEVGQGSCQWSWTARKAGGKTETRTQSCAAPLVIARVPFALNRAVSGVSVQVKLPDGRVLAEPRLMVEDLFIVAMGDSFASGESNPDRPVSFSASRQMVYDPSLNREDDYASRGLGLKWATAPQPALLPKGFDPKVLPRRSLEDEQNGQYYPLMSSQFRNAFEKSGPRWLSPDCHRSQYGYPFRVGLQLALEDPHRSVTLVSLACTGAEVTEGLFLDKKAREGALNSMVQSQFDQLSDLICTGPRTVPASYQLPVYASGSTDVHVRRVNKIWCAPNMRKRPIDTVLLSIGGNDVGFSALMVYAMTESAGDLAPIANLVGQQIRFSPEVSRVYLDRLPERMKAARDALRDGFGVPPNRVFQTAYEPIQFDENGMICGGDPSLGMDVHPKLQMSRPRLQQTVGFLQDFFARMVCINNGRSANCPTLATGAGTGFQLITDHQPAFAKRGICARDPKNPIADGELMAIPRSSGGEEFVPYSPAAFLPYQRRWRLFRTPNDAFMTANVHARGFSLFDVLQPVYAAMYSGAVHPTAEAHAIVADHVVRHVRNLVDHLEADGGVAAARPAAARPVAAKPGSAGNPASAAKPAPFLRPAPAQ